MELEKRISSNRDAATSSLDLYMRRKFKEQQEKISKQLLLTELLKPFPNNCISLMTISGAKGGTVSWDLLLISYILAIRRRIMNKISLILMEKSV